MLTKTRRWGNSIALRIPKHIADEIGLDADREVEIKVQDGAIVIEIAKQHEETLEELLAQIDPNNLYGEIDTGSPVGNEIW
jgi:antitoxin MazE